MPPLTPKFLKSMVLVGLACGVAACDHSESTAEWWKGEQKRTELDHKLGLQQIRLERAHSNGYDELTRLQSSGSQHKTALLNLRSRKATLTQEVASLEARWPEYRDNLLQSVRKQWVGKTFETLNLDSGKSYQKAAITSIDHAGVAISHANGTARLRATDLSMGERARFGLDDDLALAAVHQESRDAADYENLVAKHQEQQEIAATAKRQENQWREAEQRQRQALAVQVAPTKQNPLREPARHFGTGSSYSSYYSPTYSPSYPYSYYGYPTYSYGYSSGSTYYGNSNSSSSGWKLGSDSIGQQRSLLNSD